MKLIVLCGGLGTRLGKLTQTTPKALVDVGDRKIIDWALKNYPDYEYIFSTGFGFSRVYDYASTKYPKSTFVVEEKALGTGGAIKYAAETFCDDYFAVINGDTYSSFNLRQILEEMVYNNPKIDCAVCIGKSHLTGLLQYAGAFVFHRRFLSYITPHLEDAILDNKSTFIVSKNYFYDLGTLDGIQKFSQSQNTA